MDAITKMIDDVSGRIFTVEALDFLEHTIKGSDEHPDDGQSPKSR
jgi:hypothetical protein